MKHTFELPEIDTEIELELDFTYSYDPGCYSGLPENCYPSEEDAEITLEPEWEKRVIRIYTQAMQNAIKSIHAQCDEMCSDGTVASWANEEREAAEMSRAEAYIDDRKYWGELQ